MDAAGALEERSCFLLRRTHPYLIRPVAWLFRIALAWHERRSSDAERRA